MKKIPIEAKRRLKYDPGTGHLIWKSRPLSDFKTQRSYTAWNTKYAGTRAGCINTLGYHVVKIDGIPYYAHRIIVYIMKGWNKTHMEIDHRYGDRSDNRLEMIRPATRGENSCTVSLEDVHK